MDNEIENLLEADHAAISRLLEKTLDGFSARTDDRFQRLDMFWARLAMHIRAEHLHLFPAVMSSPGTSPHVTRIIARFRGEHDDFMRELAAIVKSAGKTVLSVADPEDLLARLRDLGSRLNDHDRTEEETIYASDRLRLEPDEYRRLAEKIRHEITALPPRFLQGAGTDEPAN